MKFVLVLIFSFYLHCCLSYEEIDELIVRINDGEILGRYMTSESGKTVSAFLGIPFARPPIDDLRFTAPQKVVPWNVTLFTQQERSKCPQIDSLIGSTVYEGNEDCLYVNVYVPERSTDGKFDVLVWFHGGGLVLGHSGPSTYGPDYLLEHDVILVAGNYRLGALGFLSTEDRNCPGNFGFKDQVFLLFFHMISPMSQGLFHRGISNSGRQAEPARAGVGKDQAIRLAELMNCPTIDEDTADIVKCLKNVSSEAIVYAAGSFPVVVEFFESAGEAFIENRNYGDLLSNSVEIPWLLGINNEEGLLSMAPMLSNGLLLNNLVATWNRVLPSTFGYSHLNQDEQDEITTRINRFYFGNESTPTNQLDMNNLIDLFTDRYLAIIETVKHRLSYSDHQSTYIYLYTHKGTSSFSTATDFFGTCHADDLIPLFPLRKSSFYSAIPTEQDSELTKAMTLMWTNFARTGNPTPDNTATPIWPTASSFPLNYMQIGNENGKFDSQIVQPRIDFYPARVNFWIELRDEYQISSWFESSSSTSCRYSLSVIGFLIICWHFINW